MMGKRNIKPQPKNRQEWEEREKELGIAPSEIGARCSVCGRGYHYTEREGAKCLACKGPVYSIKPAPPAPAEEVQP